MGKGKLALDKAVSATTGPMGSRPMPLSQPLCPCPRVPTEGFRFPLTTSSQAGAFLGHGKSCPSCVGSEVCLRALRLLGAHEHLDIIPLS